MKRRSSRPTGAHQDVRFRLPDGRIVDLPAKRWLLANQARLRPRLGLLPFLAMLPGWILTKVEEDAERRTRSVASAPGEPSSSIILTLEHLKLWLPQSTTSTSAFLEAFPCYVEQFQAACSLESLRRNGVLRVHVSGEDRLDRESPRSIELNPAVLAELTRSELPPGGDVGLLQRLSELTQLARQTDWADLAALEDDSAT